MSTPDNVAAHLSRIPLPTPLPTRCRHPADIPADLGPTLPAQNLERFNTAPAPEVHRTLLTCLHSPRWAHRVAAHRPYPGLPSLLAAADEATYDLGPEELAGALAEEPLPKLPDHTYAAASTALSAGYAAYEARFGHTFVICLDGTAPDETLDRVLPAIRSRLTNDPEDERAVAREELRRLANGRLRGFLGAATAPSVHL